MTKLRSKDKRSQGMPVMHQAQMLPFNGILNRMANKLPNDAAVKKQPKRGIHGARLVEEKRKLTADEVRQIRKEWNSRNTAKLAKKFNITEGALRNLIDGANYAWVI